MAVDWRLIFTNAYHNPKMQTIIEEHFFKGEQIKEFSKEELEGLIVSVCSTLMEQIERRNKK